MSRECEDFQPYESFERKCKLLLKEEEIRFAGIINSSPVYVNAPASAKEEEIRFAGIINGMGRLLAGNEIQNMGNI